jgi:DNA-binding XRE family transcriptional regulator
MSDKQQRPKDSVDELMGVLILRRERLKMTKAALADKIGVDRAWLKKVEDGLIQPQIRTILAYCEAVGMDFTWTLRAKK